MRPIKYRAWDKHDKKMYPVIVMDLVQEKGGLFLGKGKGPVSWEDIELLEFTGLTDRNGTEIYESDIITGKDGKFKIKGVVKFKEGCFWCMIPPDDYFEPFPDLMEGYEVEVGGNVFENPGLLKGE